MILSRTLAKRHISAGTRPRWLAAWVPVALDFALFGLYAVLIFGPLTRSLHATQTSQAATFVILFFVIFVPMQIILILSALWASKSRFIIEDEGNQS